MTEEQYGGIVKVDSFTIVKSDLGHVGGRYLSKSPLAAAKKMATQLFKLIKTEPKYKKLSGKTITFTIRKTTNNSNKKEYEYTANQSKLQKPIEVIINGKTIQYKYKLTVKKKKRQISSKKGGCGCNNKDS